MPSQASAFTACAHAFAEAVRVHDGDSSVTAAARLISARVALFTCLVDGGWTPPSAVAAQLKADRILLREGDDARFEPAAGGRLG